MLAFIGGVLACGFAIFWFTTMRAALADSALERRFRELHALTRKMLPPEQLVALTRELEEIRAAQHVAVLQGAKLEEAHRMGQRAAIRSMTNHLELHRAIPG